ncbi:MAG TPA: serine/threonine-protein kinase [Gemmatales bacterium]|nr:serine/threonine-protein kinase [Gemmatales bacterium]
MIEESIFHAALAKTIPAERVAYLDEACGPDLELRRQIELLLEAHQVTSNLLDRSPPDLHEASTKEHSTGNYTSKEPASGVVVAGRYTLEQKLGEGGMGEVWIAAQNDPVKRKVALKFIRPGMDSQAVLARFDQERQALAIMDHPNIAKILDGGATETGRPFFVMELVRGLPITKYCDQEKLTPRERLALFALICQGVQHAHQKGIIHRDIKPSNILVGLYDGQPVPKIIDFGVAKATGRCISTKSVHTEIGSLLGTLEYMSPEQADLTNLDIDTRTDVYALGVVLYELLTGTVPFTRNDFAEAGMVQMLMMIKEKEPQKPSTKISTLEELPNIAAHRKSDPARLQHLLQGELDWITMKCLEKVRDRRYDTPGSLALDIQHYLHDEPVQAGPPSVSYRFRKFVRRHRGKVFAASVILGILVASIIVTTWLLLRALHAETMWQEESVRTNKAAIQAQSAEEVTATINAFITKDILFSVDTFRRSGIRNNPFGEVPLRESLDRAVERMNTAYSKKPLVEAGLLLTIGKAYRILGFPEKSKPLLDRALAIRIVEQGENHQAVIEVEIELGRIWIELTHYKDADRFYDTLIKKCWRELGPNHNDTITVTEDSALAKEGLREFATAEQIHLRTLAFFKQAPGQHDQEILDTRAKFANNLMLQGKLPDAEKEFLEVLQGQRKEFGLNNSVTIGTMTNLSIAYRHMFIDSGRKTKSYLEKGETLCRQTLSLGEQAFGKDHPEYLIAELVMANILYDADKLDEAVALFSSLNPALERRADPNHELVLSSRLTYGALLTKKGNPQGAKPILLDVYQRLSKKYPSNDQRVRTALLHLINCLKKLGEADLVKEYEQKLSKPK